MNDGKNMAGMVSEKVQACGDGFCDRAAREAVGRFSPKERAVMYGTAADTTFYERLRSDEAAGTPGTPIGLDAFLSASENAKRPCCPCFTGSVLGCLCACHRLGSASGVATLGGYTTQGMVGGPKTTTYGIAQQAKAPGKQFTRSDILAILRAQRAVAGNVADSEYQKLLTIFENLE